MMAAPTGDRQADGASLAGALRDSARDVRPSSPLSAGDNEREGWDAG